MNYKNQIIEKIKKKEAILGVVGLGYVGLPLAVEKAKAGFKVIGFDIQKKRVDMVNRGENYIGDVVDEELKKLVKNKMIVATCDYSRIAECDTVAICVPTPLDKYMQPDISYVLNSSKEISKYVKKGTLVVLESTTYPGTTEEVIMPIFKEKGFTIGEDLFLAFSPERVDPGNKIYKTKNTPKVVGGVTKSCQEVSKVLYESVLEGEIFVTSSPKVAEMEKILENTFRNINIALINEMAILCDKMGIDIWEVIEAAKTKPYGFMAFYPGPGLGGHCIPIDPYYLTWKAREYNYHTRLIELAGEINNYMPEYVVNKAAKILNEFKKSINGSEIFILGVAYKKDIDDLRESPVLKILEILEKAHAEIMINDPFIPEFTHNGVTYKSVELTEENLKKADLVIITTDHSVYGENMIVSNSKVVFDTRHLIKNKKDNVWYL